MNKSLLIIALCLGMVIVFSGCVTEDTNVRTYTYENGTTVEMDQDEYICKFDVCLNYGTYTYNPTTKLCQCYTDEGVLLNSYYVK